MVVTETELENLGEEKHMWPQNLVMNSLAIKLKEKHNFCCSLFSKRN